MTLAKAEVTRISLEDYPLPLFDADLAGEAAALKAVVRRLVEIASMMT